MKIGIFANQTPYSLNIKKQLTQKFIEHNFIMDDFKPDIVVTVGGDGTLLAAFHHYEKQLATIRFVGVHTGHLGFYTDWRSNELDELIKSLESDNGQAVCYPLLDLTVNYQNQKSAKHYLALNESTLKRADMAMAMDVYIDDHLFEHFKGDGLCVSAPTGSTAYNKSLGGAVVYPGLDALQLAEISSINNLVYRTLSSPLIISSSNWVTFKPTSMNNFIFTIDQQVYCGEAISSVTFKISAQKIRFAKYRHTPFWKRIQTAFIGDVNEN